MANALERGALREDTVCGEIRSRCAVEVATAERALSAAEARERNNAELAEQALAAVEAQCEERIGAVREAAEATLEQKGRGLLEHVQRRERVAQDEAAARSVDVEQVEAALRADAATAAAAARAAQARLKERSE